MGPEEILAAIQHINVKFSDKDFVKAQTGNVLSYTALKLAAMKAYIVDEKETAQAEMLESEVNMDKAKAQAYLKAKNEHNATAASDLKYMDPDFIAARMAYAEKKVYYDRLKSVVADTHDLIEAIRSRVIDLQGARKDESIR